MPINRRMDKEDVVCVCVYICHYGYIWNVTQPLKRNEVLTQATTWMNL